MGWCLIPEEGVMVDARGQEWCCDHDVMLQKVSLEVHKRSWLATDLTMKVGRIFTLNRKELIFK